MTHNLNILNSEFRTVTDKWLCNQYCKAHLCFYLDHINRGKGEANFLVNRNKNGDVVTGQYGSNSSVYPLFSAEN